MASQKPEIVLQIALELLEKGTQNVFIHRDLAEAALAMPPHLAACWVEKEIEWLKKQDFLNFSLKGKLSKLVTYLIQGNKLDVAFALLQELLAVFPNSKSSSYLRKASAHFDEYEYEKLLQNKLPKLLEVAGERTFKMLCDFLDQEVSLSPSQDYSHQWRTTIESNLSDGITDILISAVRDAAEYIVEKDLIKVHSLVLELESYQWTIFQRIALHLIRKFSQEAQDLITERLRDRNRLQPTETFYEYELLLKEQFPNLSEEVQQEIVQSMMQGPDLPKEKSDEKTIVFIKHWQRNWLAIVSEHLPEFARERYQELVKEIGRAEPLKAREGIQIFEGPNSPILLEQLAAMSLEDLFTFLREWQHSEKIPESSRKALGYTLSIVIAQKPEKFVVEIEQFKQLHIEYKVALLEGLKQGLQRDRDQSSEIPENFWYQVLSFCFWILEQHKEIRSISSDPAHGFNEWSRICNGVVTLIDIGIQLRGTNEILIELRSQVWKLLEPLTNDSKLTPGFEKDYHGSNASPTNDSFNTVRGQAMHAVMRYALWVQRHTKTDESQDRQVEFNFDKIPEVRAVLEHHLDPTHDPSLVIRSIYGQWFSTLMSLDSEWTIKNQEKIFPIDDGLQKLREAAWEGYITFNRADVTLFTMLRKEYRQALERFSDDVPNWQNFSRTDEVLTEHLCSLYWHEELELGESDTLLERFFAKAPAHLREEFMRQIVRKLRYGNFEVKVDLLQRLQKLWEWRINHVKNATINSVQASDLKYFSGWFTSEKFDSNWAITQLKEVIRLAKDINYDNHLLPHLAALSRSMPLSIVECLNLMADELQSVDWPFSCDQEDIRTILSTVFQSEDEKSHKAATDLINRLLARGMADYRDLLTDIRE